MRGRPHCTRLACPVCLLVSTRPAHSQRRLHMQRQTARWHVRYRLPVRWHLPVRCHLAVQWPRIPAESSPAESSMVESSSVEISLVESDPRQGQNQRRVPTAPMGAPSSCRAVLQSCRSTAAQLLLHSPCPGAHAPYPSNRNSSARPATRPSHPRRSCGQVRGHATRHALTATRLRACLPLPCSPPLHLLLAVHWLLVLLVVLVLLVLLVVLVVARLRAVLVVAHLVVAVWWTAVPRWPGAAHSAVAAPRQVAASTAATRSTGPQPVTAQWAAAQWSSVLWAAAAR